LEIKINKEIRHYQESLFFGLSTRQFIFSVLALGVAVAVYFLLKEPLGEETVSWLCIVAAAPVAFMGFFRYQGMNAEGFLWAVIKSEFLYAGPRRFVGVNLYEEAAELARRPQRKEKAKKK
jgi:hypothetical protein